jgi:two-component sensor histidine kinase
MGPDRDVAYPGPPKREATASPDTGGNTAAIGEVVGGICHRAKNDLQTVANLLALASPHARTPADLAEAVEGRVGALSVCYTLASEGGSAPTLDRLAQEVVRRSLWRARWPVVQELDLEPQPLSVRLCSPLSLWLHETVVNALVHGLDAATARLEISGGLEESGLVLRVRDHGPGPPPGFDPAGAGRLGLKIAEAVAKSDLRGAMRLTAANPGLEARLEVPRHEFEQLNRAQWG